MLSHCASGELLSVVLLTLLVVPLILLCTIASSDLATFCYTSGELCTATSTTASYTSSYTGSLCCAVVEFTLLSLLLC
jgi:hypothetical protein